MENWVNIALGIKEDIPACDFKETYFEVIPAGKVRFGFYSPEGRFLRAKSVEAPVLTGYIQRHEKMSNGTPPTKEHIAYLVWMGVLPEIGGRYVQDSETTVVAVRD
jgi:hypothetical protein